jgi:RNA polymerase sigma factor (sigma-70 family)
VRIYSVDNKRLESLSQTMVYNQYCLSGGTNKVKLEKMKKHLSKAFRAELTERQSYCITQYYLNGRKMCDIAKDMNITPSVVSRHISRGIKKLQRSLPYFEE